jgi:hypothetical protein
LANHHQPAKPELLDHVVATATPRRRGSSFGHLLSWTSTAELREDGKKHELRGRTLPLAKLSLTIARHEGDG